MTIRLSSIFFALIVCIFSIEASAQFAKKGTCTLVRGTMARVISKYEFAVQLYNSPRDFDVLISATLYDGQVGGTVEGHFESLGSRSLKIIDENGRVRERVLPYFKFSKKCQDHQSKAERDAIKLGTKKQTFRKD